jgi:Dockerin type I domain
MNKSPSSKSGIFNPRVLLAVALCLAGIFLTMFSFAIPAPSGRADAQVTGTFQPVVSYSVANGISPAMRDLPIVLPSVPTERIAEGPRPLHPPQPPPKLPVYDPVQQTSPGLLTMPSPNITFEGIAQSEACGGCIPPDTNGAVGPNHYVQSVNEHFAVYSKTGTLLAGPAAINSLFSSLPTGNQCRIRNNGDPVVLYDRLADRWLITQFTSAAPYEECVAISTGPDPAGTYYVYDFHLSNTVFHDYPKLGVWPDAYYMTTNQFPPNQELSQGYGAWAFERAKMLVGQPARQVFFDLGTVNTMFSGALPSDADSPPPAGSPNYFVEVDDEVIVPPTDAMRIWKFHVDWTNPASSTFGNAGQPDTVITVPDFTPPECVYGYGVCVQQLESPYSLDVLGDRIMFRLAYRNFGDHEAFVVNHSVVADARVGIRWYEVRNLSTTPTIYQTGTFAPIDTLHRWMGSMAMDRNGDIAVGYSTSSAASFPSIAYAGRLVGDPLGQLSQGEAQMFAGLGSENVADYIPPEGRWGDYSDLTVDPTDDCTFWYTTEYFPAGASTNIDAPWQTRIGSFKFPTCVAPVELVKVESRMQHGSSGIFKVSLPLTGTRGVECRSGVGGVAGKYSVVFRFLNPLMSVGGASVTSGTGTISNSGIGTDTHEYVVNLTGVTNGQYITVGLTNVTDSLGHSSSAVSSPQMGVLTGDVNGDGQVDSGDLVKVKQQTLQPVNDNPGTSNFREDVNPDGSIDSGDLLITKRQTLTGLPTPP